MARHNIPGDRSKLPNWKIITSMKKEWIFPIKKCQFLDIQLSCPADAKSIISFHYGSNAHYTAYYGAGASQHSKMKKKYLVDMTTCPVLFLSSMVTNKYGKLTPKERKSMYYYYPNISDD